MGQGWQGDARLPASPSHRVEPGASWQGCGARSGQITRFTDAMITPRGQASVYTLTIGSALTAPAARSARHESGVTLPTPGSTHGGTCTGRLLSNGPGVFIIQPVLCGRHLAGGK